MATAEKLVTFDNGIKIIGHIQSSKIIAICGQARVGKSTFINTYFGKKIAKTSNEQESCTKDIDFYTNTVRDGKIKEAITFLDVEGDDMGDLTKNLKMARFTASISQIFIYYARDKISTHSLETIRYIKKYSNAIMILFVRSELKHKDSDIFDHTFTFKDSYNFLQSSASARLKKIINSVPIRDSGIIMQTLRENINLQVPKLYSAFELEKNCKDLLQKCTEKGVCELCGNINYDIQIKNQYNHMKKKYDCKVALQKCEDENICNYCDDFDYDEKIRETRRYNLERIEEKKRYELEKGNQDLKDLAMVGLPFLALLLSDHQFKENIVRNEVNFCWKWKFAEAYACGEIIGICYENYEFKDYIEFAGVYFIR